MFKASHFYRFFAFILLFFTSLSIFCSVSDFRPLSEPTAVQVIYNMFSKTKDISTMSFVMKKLERINGKMEGQESAVKLNVHPFKMYLKQLSPKKGLEVLYVHGENGNKAMINTNGFPWVNLYLDPMGNVMRDKQHHTIYESGYAHLMSILEHLTTKYQKELETIVTKKGSEVFEGHPCWVIIFADPYFKYYNHTVKQGETILSLANKDKLSEHMIMEKNPKVKEYGDIKPNQVIVLPNDYSPKLELYVDKARMVPLVMKVYDDKGLYEYYEYGQVKINPIFSAEDFSRSNSAYGF